MIETRIFDVYLVRCQPKREDEVRRLLTKEISQLIWLHKDRMRLGSRLVVTPYSDLHTLPLRVAADLPADLAGILTASGQEHRRGWGPGTVEFEEVPATHSNAERKELLQAREAWKKEKVPLHFRGYDEDRRAQAQKALERVTGWTPERVRGALEYPPALLKTGISRRQAYLLILDLEEEGIVADIGDDRPRHGRPGPHGPIQFFERLSRMAGRV